MEPKHDRIESPKAQGQDLERSIRLLHRVASLVRTSFELEPAIDAILKATTGGEGLAMDRAMLFVREDDGGLRGVRAVGPGTATGLDAKVRGLRVDLWRGSPIAQALRTGELIIGEGEDDLDGLLHLETGVAAPLIGRTGPMGVLFGDNMVTGRSLHATSQLVLDLLADHAARVIEVARLYEGAAAQVRVDALTGLPHHGSLMDALSQVLAEAASSEQALGLIMLDVDDFEQVADAHGRRVGDALLGYFAGRLKGVVRSPEHVYRYGGEQLTVLVPDGDAKATVAIAERICEEIRRRPFSIEEEVATGDSGEQLLLPVTCSLGVAAFPSHGSTATALIRAADGALLEAKRAGKNRVILAE